MSDRLRYNSLAIEEWRHLNCFVIARVDYPNLCKVYRRLNLKVLKMRIAHVWISMQGFKWQIHFARSPSWAAYI